MLRRRMPRRIQASLRTSLPGGRAHHGVAPRTGAYQGPDVSPRAPFLLARPAFISRSCQDHRDSCPPAQRLTTEIPDCVLFQSGAVNVTGPSVHGLACTCPCDAPCQDVHHLLSLVIACIYASPLRYNPIFHLFSPLTLAPCLLLSRQKHSELPCLFSPTPQPRRRRVPAYHPRPTPVVALSPTSAPNKRFYQFLRSLRLSSTHLYSHHDDRITPLQFCPLFLNHTHCDGPTANLSLQRSVASSKHSCQITTVLDQPHIHTRLPDN
jgi:hypothetical protein